MARNPAATEAIVQGAGNARMTWRGTFVANLRSNAGPLSVLQHG